MSRITLLAALATLACVSAARAGETNVTIRSIAGGDQFCMDAQGDKKGDGTPVYIYRCHGRENQRWTLTTNVDGSSAIVGTGGYCLDVRGRHSRADGTPVQLWQCHFDRNQRFRIGSDFTIREVASGKCLMALGQRDGAPIVIDDCAGLASEAWQRVR